MRGVWERQPGFLSKLVCLSLSHTQQVVLSLSLPLVDQSQRSTSLPPLYLYWALRNSCPHLIYERPIGWLVIRTQFLEELRSFLRYVRQQDGAIFNHVCLRLRKTTSTQNLRTNYQTWCSRNQASKTYEEDCTRSLTSSNSSLVMYARASLYLP